MTSCVETMKDGDMSTGFLGVPVLDADIQVEEFGATKAAPAPNLPTLSVPESSALHFKVTDSKSNVVWGDKDEDGLWTTPLQMPVGEYTIEVNYGSNTYGNPWYTGTCTVTISPVKEAVPAIGLRLCNSLLAVVLADDFTQHFTPSEGECVTISSTSGSSGNSGNITTTLGNYVFVPAGEDLTIEVAGTSSAGISKTLSWTLTQLSAATATYVTCSLTTTDAPTITMSEIPAADAWGNTAYVPLARTEHISDLNVAQMQYFASSNDWTDSVEGTVDGGTVKFTGLTPGATYKVRAQIGALKSNEVSMTMSTSALSIKTAAAHTYTNNELDGTDFTASFSVAKKFGVTASSLQLCKTDGTPLRTVALNGTSADWASDGSALTGDDTWPFLPGGNYILKGTATQNNSTVTLKECQVNVPATPDFEIIVTGTTTYDLYSSGNITAANEADAESITGIGYQVKIAQALKKNSNYNYSDSFTLDNVNVKGTTSKSGLSWANHPLVATVSFAGTVKPVQKDCYITGLPCTIAPNIDEWRDVRNSSYLSYETGSIVMNGSNTSQAPLIESKHFFIPNNTNIRTTFNYKIKSYKGLSKYWSVFYQFIGGTNVYEYTKDSDGEVTYNNTVTTGQLTGAKPYIEFEARNSYMYNPNAYCTLYETKVEYVN